MNPPTLVELTRHASTIPSLPEVVAYLMRTLNDARALRPSRSIAISSNACASAPKWQISRICFVVMCALQKTFLT